MKSMFQKHVFQLLYHSLCRSSIRKSVAVYCAMISVSWNYI